MLRHLSFFWLSCGSHSTINVSLCMCICPRKYPKDDDGKARRDDPRAYAPRHVGMQSPGPAYPSLTLMFSKLEDNPDPRDFGQQARRNFEALGNHGSTLLWFLPYGSPCEPNRPASSEEQQALLQPPPVPHCSVVTARPHPSHRFARYRKMPNGWFTKSEWPLPEQGEVCGRMDADLPGGIKELCLRKPKV